jgi:phage portal protein BeeE
MATLLDRLLGRPEAKATGTGGTGPGVVGLTYDAPLLSMGNNPQKKAAQAMAAYREHFWVGVAERAVSGPASGVGWHLEDANGETIDETSGEGERAVLDLIERPAIKQRLRRRELWALTLRHTGLVGYTFWYLDEQELLGGTPAGIYYIRPDRMLPALDNQGNLVGWIMDGDRPNGRQPVPFTIDEIVVFRLDPSDDGLLGIGLVEQAWRKISLALATDRHSEKMIASGGRLAGLITPTPDKGSFSADEYKTIVNELRAVTDSPDAAKKALIFKVPVDYKATSATPSQMNLPELMRGSRVDILAGWNVPESQIGITGPAGLNSGDTKKFDEAAVWQGAREPRLNAFRETLQYEVLDRFRALGVTVELKLHTPTFDDQLPLYELAAKGGGVPLSNNQRRALVNAPPHPPGVRGESGRADGVQ